MNSDAVHVVGVRHAYGDLEVLHGIDLTIEPGLLVSVLGKSGCGKSTLLRVIAGFETPTAGTVSIGETVVAGPGVWVPPQRRRIGYVSQDGSLFPHLTVQANVEFGMRRTERDAGMAEQLLATVSLDPSYLRRWPHELSGGQQQRVALARTLARSPDVVLLDEPFSALDTDLRASTRSAVVGILRDQGVTAVFVTHDHHEALSFSDILAIMVDGRLTQVASAAEVYDQPTDLQTAALVGGTVVLPAVACDGVARTQFGDIPLRNSPRNGPVEIMLRPEQVLVDNDEQGSACVRGVEYFGDSHLVRVEVHGTTQELQARTGGGWSGRAGDRVSVSFRGTAVGFPALQ
ncbi:MAG: ABC transporter ATP-binding protein [Actinomycetota bacterium]|nr:MAG: ABC transporter ATP-binding protein [Actinomycetota bacterium]